MWFVCSKELSHGDGSFEYPKHMFWLRNKKINFSYALLYGGLKSLINIGDRCCLEGWGGGYSSLRYKVPYSSL